ncbi:MAG: PhnD/SsuA/transferrin family substrate-binding protein [Geobacter sp.]|nr:PhnD/SsuA/transferrin family substrate-binding protein [Geobacter sp.]
MVHICTCPRWFKEFHDANSLFILDMHPGAVARAAAITYTPSPIEHIETAVTSHAPLADHLAKILGRPVKIRYEQKHADIIRLFREGQIDLAQMGPLPYVKLREQFHRAIPLAIFKEADGRTSYNCALVTAFDGPKRVGELRGSIALVQPLSTCGQLGIDYILGRHGKGIGQFSHEYLGNQDNVALAVIRGEYAAGGVKSSIAAKYASLSLRIMEETPPFPGLVLVGNGATLSREQLEAIRKALLALPPESSKRFIAGKFGFAPVVDRDYQVIRDYLGAR